MRGERIVKFQRLSKEELKKEKALAKLMGLVHPESGIPDLEAIKKAFGFEPESSEDTDPTRTTDAVRQNKPKKLKLPIKEYDYSSSDISSSGDHNLHADRQ